MVPESRVGRGEIKTRICVKGSQSRDSIRAAPTGLVVNFGDAFPGVRCASPWLFSIRPYGTKSRG
jgi:hypothetical protein